MAEGKVAKHVALCVREPKVAVKEAPIVAPPKVSTEELTIPDNVQDTSFMQGRWLCHTGLVNSKTLEPVQVEFIFDNLGQGTGTVYEKDDRCTGKAQASFENNILHITHNNLICSKRDGAYVKNKINCKKNDLGKTECFGENTDGSSWDATFYKFKD